MPAMPGTDAAPSHVELRQRLNDKLDRLTPEGCAALEPFVDALGTTVTSTPAAGSDVVTMVFDRRFAASLLLHHAHTRLPMVKTVFEHVTVAAFRADGRCAALTDNATYPGRDLTVNGVGYSLKTSAAKKINANFITISKFSEAQQIRDCRTGEDFRRLVARIFDKHLASYARVLKLRVFLQAKDVLRYELVELPYDLLAAAALLKADDFSPRTPKGGTIAVITRNGEPAWKLRLDGSVEKVTISQFRVALCVTHGRWVVPVTAEADV